MPDDMPIVDQLSFSTVLIECKSESESGWTGTGFIFSFPVSDGRKIPILITNRHVIENAITISFRFTLIKKDGTPDIGRFTTVQLDHYDELWTYHPDENIDLCAMRLAPLFNIDKSKQQPFFTRAIPKEWIATHETMQELSALEEIVMIGYPAGIWDSFNNMPIFRRGVTATRPELDYEGRKEFMIDAACFEGSSGSPVLLVNIGGYTNKFGNMIRGNSRVKLLGILYGIPPYVVDGKIVDVSVPVEAKLITETQMTTNLGHVIKAEKILDFEEELWGCPVCC